MNSKPSSSDSAISVKYEYSPLFPEILEHCRVSLLISTYQAGKLMVLGSRSGKLEISFRSLELAMGVAAAHQGIAVGSKRNIWFLSSHPELAKNIPPAGAYDACFLARNAQFTGSIQVHELAWGTEGLWVVNTLFSTLCTLHEDFNFIPRWQPKFISSLAAEDRCHLNGIAMEHGAPRFVTAMSQTDTAAGWRPTKAESGVVIDVASQEIVCSGLAMPHSPRVYNQRLWVLDSGRGELSQVDLHRGTAETVARLPGYTRGLAFNGQFAFVGLSRIREAHIFGGLPVQKEFDQLNCGIGIIDLVSGKNVAAFQFHSGVEEIFDVQLLPGVQNPFLRGPGDEDEHEVWVVPTPTQNHATASAQHKPIFYRRDLGPNSNHAPADPRQLVQAGLNLQEQGRLAEAVVNYQAAIALDPSYTDPIINLGNVYQELNKSDEAIACYREAIRINPRSVNAYRNLGYLLKEQGLHEEGLQQLRQAQRLEPNPVIEFVLRTNLPPIYSSLEDLKQRRLQLEVNVQTLCDSGFQLDATQSAAPTNFYAAYQGLNDRSLQTQLASLIKVPQPVLKRRSPKLGGRIRVGFISRHYRNHTIGRLNLGIIRNLPRDLFEVVVISVGSHQDRMAEEFARAADQYIALPTNLSAIRSAVLDLDLDVLYYSDVGMDTLTYTLSLSRLAPVQCATWGHPETTGSPAIDYFISSQTLETADADQHYSEQLERLAVLNVFYYRPESPKIRDHAYFGLDSKKNNYLCFQNLFKIHPEFDEILSGILRRDPRAAIIMMEPRYPAWGESLRARWRQSIGSLADRIQFLKTQPHEDFLSLNAIADVSLDPIHFGGGNTSYEAFAVGLPVVTLPSQFLRARISQALYRQMDFVDLIAKSPQQYIDLAVQLGTIPELRKATSKTILEQSGKLFEDHRAIDELVKFFLRVVTDRTPKS